MLETFALPQALILIFMLAVALLNSLFLLQPKLGRGMMFFIVAVQIVFFAVCLDFYLVERAALTFALGVFHVVIGAWAFARAT